MPVGFFKLISIVMDKSRTLTCQTIIKRNDSHSISIITSYDSRSSFFLITNDMTQYIIYICHCNTWKLLGGIQELKLGWFQLTYVTLKFELVSSHIFFVFVNYVLLPLIFYLKKKDKEKQQHGPTTASFRIGNKTRCDMIY